MAVPLILSDVPDTTPYIQYIATNGQTVFPYPFPITQDSDLIVLVNGVTLATDAGYSLSGQGDDTGGNLTFTLGQTAGAIITLYRDIPIERISQIAQNSGFSSTVFNAEYNNIYLILQQLETSIGFSLQIPNTNNPAPVTTLTPANYAGKYLSFDQYGNPQPTLLTSSGSLTATIIGSLIGPPTTAEINAGVTVVSPAVPVNNVLRYGIVPNNTTPSVLSSNTTILKVLLNPLITTGPTGVVSFPNTTGADVYSFNGVIPIRDGISLDLGGCTLSYTGSVVANDASSGFLFGVRDFNIYNGTISCAVDTSVAGSSGFAIQVGARGDESSYFQGSWDSLLAKPQGNVRLSNLHIVVNNTGSNLASTGGIQSTGGLQNVTVDNVSIDGSGTAQFGFYYEFGWATSGTTNLRQTAHAHNLTVSNLNVKNVTTAVTFAGVYNGEARNIIATACASAFVATPGESLFYRPGASVDTAGAKRNIRVINVTGQGLTASGISLSGEQLASGGYLSAIISGLGHPGDYLAETDLGSFVVDGFSLDGSGNPGNGLGIFLNGSTRADIRNGSIFGGFQRGIALTDEAQSVNIEHVGVHACTQSGIYLNQGAGIWSPVRTRKVRIANSYIAGNGTSSPNNFAGIQLSANVDSCIIENNRINYDSAFHGTDEAVQAQAVDSGTAGASNIIVRNNHIGAIAGGGVAFRNVNTSVPSLGCLLDGNTGIVTSSGQWDGTEQSWTPTLTAATVGDLAVTYGTRQGGYTRRGNRIEYWFDIVTSAFTYTSASSTARITGLPYVSSTVTSKTQIGSLAFGGITKTSYTQFAPNVGTGQQLITIQASGTGQAIATMAITDFPTGGTVTLQGSGFYFV